VRRRIHRQFTDRHFDQSSRAKAFQRPVVPVLMAIVLVTLGRAVAIDPVLRGVLGTVVKVESRHQHILFGEA